MRTYTLKEAAKKINTSTRKIKQWEKDLAGLLVIPRTQQGARFCTDTVIDQLLFIQELYSNNIGKEAIQDILKMQEEPVADTSDTPETQEYLETGETPETLETKISVTPIEHQKASEIEGSPQNSPEIFLEAIERYKQNFLNEVKEIIRKELVEEVKKELSNGTYYTSKTLSDSIYKSNANISAHIQLLTNIFEKANEQNAESLKSIHKRISHQTIETSQEFYNISRQLSETSEEIAHYIDVTNHEISSLTEAIEKEREFYAEDFEEFRHEIKQREMAFQGMLADFREAAATKSAKKWWKFW